VIQFRVNLPHLIRMQWYDLARKLNSLSLNDDEDIPIWKWTGNRKFSVKSVYMQLTKGCVENGFRVIWK
jgi:hypothetical protein